ncbi:hypothetical protein MAR_008446 [Mya arenaria]|uniref:Uncharacterized protein n=1 Tax=Mya arenaria TaxID=6604 RepID=A0ABY7DVZ5_MYAAR|nr:hypothetical protein MAR_008446 [Mya arenaria]
MVTPIYLKIEVISSNARPTEWQNLLSTTDWTNVLYGDRNIPIEEEIRSTARPTERPKTGVANLGWNLRASETGGGTAGGLVPSFTPTDTALMFFFTSVGITAIVIPGMYRGDTIDMKVNKKGVVVVTEIGRVIEQGTLSSMPWPAKLQMARQVLNLLQYLEGSPLGSLGFDQLQTHDFLIVGSSNLRLIDLDNLNIGEPSCTTDSECRVSKGWDTEQDLNLGADLMGGSWDGQGQNSDNHDKRAHQGDSVGQGPGKTVGWGKQPGDDPLKL